MAARHRHAAPRGDRFGGRRAHPVASGGATSDSSPRSSRRTTSACSKPRATPSNAASTSTRRSWRGRADAMGETTGFMKYDRELPKRRPIPVRVLDWQEVYEDFPPEKVRTQGARCMDCGIPFCHTGCPLGNLIPEWNDLVYRDHWQAAIDGCTRRTTSPSSPAGCARRRARPRACSASTSRRSRSSRSRSRSSTARGTKAGSCRSRPSVRTGKRVAVVGSGPAGLAAAQQLTRAGHDVTVYERADRIGGLLRYGIPEFKMEKRHLDRRIEQMAAEGTEFRTNANVGDERAGRRGAASSTRSCSPAARPRGATCRSPAASCTASTRRWSTCRWSNRVQEGDLDEPPITRAGQARRDHRRRRHRRRLPRHRDPPGRGDVHQFEILPRPPDERPDAKPWPT